LLVLLDDRWSYFGAVAQIAPDGPKCPMIGHPVFQCRFCRILQKSVRIAVMEPAIQHISVFCVRNFIGPHSSARAAPQRTEKMSRKCPAVHRCPDIRRGRYPPPESGRAPRRSPRSYRTRPATSPAALHSSSDWHTGQSCMAAVPWKGGAVFQRKWWKIIQPAGSPVSFPLPRLCTAGWSRCFGRSLPPGRTPER